MTSTPTPGGPAGKGPATRITPRQIAVLAIFIVLVVFIAQNRDPVRVDLFTITVTAPLWNVLVVMVLVGLVIGLLLRRRR